MYGNVTYTNLHICHAWKTEANEEAKVKPVRMFPVLGVLHLLRVAAPTTVKSYVITVKLYTKIQNYSIQN